MSRGETSGRLAGAQLRTSAVADMNAEHDLRMGWRGLPKNAEPLRSAPYPISP